MHLSEKARAVAIKCKIYTSFNSVLTTQKYAFIKEGPTNLKSDLLPPLML